MYSQTIMDLPAPEYCWKHATIKDGVAFSVSTENVTRRQNGERL